MPAVIAGGRIFATAAVAPQKQPNPIDTDPSLNGPSGDRGGPGRGREGEARGPRLLIWAEPEVDVIHYVVDPRSNMRKKRPHVQKPGKETWTPEQMEKLLQEWAERGMESCDDQDARLKAKELSRQVGTYTGDHSSSDESSNNKPQQQQPEQQQRQFTRNKTIPQMTRNKTIPQPCESRARWH